MNASAQSLSAAGWSLTVGAATLDPATESAEFHAIYLGEIFGASRRGALAVLSHGVGAGRAAMEAAQIAAQSFAEGFFGAPATLGAGPAAGRSLSSVNAWLFSQSRRDPERLGMAAALTALSFGASKKIGVVHVGDCRVYRKRRGALEALTDDHLRPVAGDAVLTRALGADTDVQADFLDADAEILDRFILVSPGFAAHLPPARLNQLLSLDLDADSLARRAVAEAGAPATAVVIDIGGVPEPEFDDIAAAYADLPLRSPPQEGDNWDGFLVGRTLYRSRYTLLKLARDTSDNSQVVLKFPLPAMAQDQVFRAGFLREAWIGATVRSRWTVGYIDLPPERRRSLYLVMPYYPGQTLEQRLLAQPPIGFAEGVGIGLKLCQAVEDLLRLQVVHRDIKPENVILLSDGDLRLLDLGLAFLPGADSSESDQLGGTTRYMAPELFKGVVAGPRSEVFSLGVTLYRLFSGGDFPFGRREAWPLARSRPDIPQWFGRALAQAIDADPERRFSGPAAFREALEQGLLHGAAPTPLRVRRPDSLLLWRMLTAIFAIAFLTLLLKGR
jgi:serine/threonine protein phosphatase PrpC